jgi:hypothetical protein
MASSSPLLNSVLVAVPSTGGVIKSKTAETLFGVARVLTANGVRCDLLNVDGSDVVTVRNFYANRVLRSQRWDGLLFVDSDMAFDPALVMRLMKFNASITAAACTTRELDLKKFHEAMLDHGDIDRAKADSSRFTVLKTFDTRRKIVSKRRDGFYTMAAVGMAVCLIRKTALRAMVHEGAVEKRADVRDGVKSESWAFFDHYRLGDMVLLEDYSFCYRWTELMKRPLWVCTDAAVQHLGDFAYGAKYQSVLEGEFRKGNAVVEKLGEPAADLPKVSS